MVFEVEVTLFVKRCCAEEEAVFRLVPQIILNVIVSPEVRLTDISLVMVDVAPANQIGSSETVEVTF